MSFYDNYIAPYLRPVVETATGAGTVVGDVGSRLTDLTLTKYKIPDSTLNQNEYDFSYKVFPSDLTENYNGHYMVININVPVTSTALGYGGNPRGAFTATQYMNVIDKRSKVDTLRFGDYALEGANPDALKTASFSLPRYTKRIKESIALYMPAGLVFNTQNKYEEISLTALGAKYAATALSTVAAGAAGAFGSSLTRSIVRNSASIGSSRGSDLGKIASVAGYPINPRIEVLYSSTDLRQFRFEVLMAPRNEKESIAIDAIVRTLRFHAAPEIDPNTKGFSFIPPAEFDLTFYNRGEENTKIPRINTCVLSLIEVDYAPAGPYSTFANGYPVATRMTLGFTEVEPLHKMRVAQGF